MERARKEQVKTFVVMVPDGDQRPYFVHRVLPEFEAALPRGTRIYEVEFYADDDDPIDVPLALCAAWRLK